MLPSPLAVSRKAHHVVSRGCAPPADPYMKSLAVSLVLTHLARLTWRDVPSGLFLEDVTSAKGNARGMVQKFMETGFVSHAA